MRTSSVIAPGDLVVDMHNNVGVCLGLVSRVEANEVFYHEEQSDPMHQHDRYEPYAILLQDRFAHRSSGCAHPKFDTLFLKSVSGWNIRVIRSL